MAAPKGGNKGSFKKGKSGNPKGKKPLSLDIREARNLSYEDMCRSVIEARSATINQLKNINLDTIPLGKRAILNAYLKFDYRGIKDYEDRLWGKAKENLELTGKDGGPVEHDITGDIKNQSEEYIAELLTILIGSGAIAPKDAGITKSETD